MAVRGKIVNRTMAEIAAIKNGWRSLKTTVIGTVGAAGFNSKTLGPAGG